MNSTYSQTILTVALTFLLSISAATSEPASRSKSAQKLDRYIVAAGNRLNPLAIGALKRIPSNARRLLAIKYYLLRADKIEERWPWTAQEVREYRKSDEYRQMVADIDSVKRKFAEMNPGYRLVVPLEARSLAGQLSNWNRVRSVATAAREVMDTCLILMADTTVGYAETPDDESLERFEEFLMEYEPSARPTVAVPGLSMHGQLHAFDFRIMRGRRLVAGASSSAIELDWDGAGWALKLKEAITAVSPRFDGPLDDPYEPWHYEYW